MRDEALEGERLDEVADPDRVLLDGPGEGDKGANVERDGFAIEVREAERVPAVAYEQEPFLLADVPVVERVGVRGVGWVDEVGGEDDVVEDLEKDFGGEVLDGGVCGCISISIATLLLLRLYCGNGDGLEMCGGGRCFITISMLSVEPPQSSNSVGAKSKEFTFVCSLAFSFFTFKFA